MRIKNIVGNGYLLLLIPTIPSSGEGEISHREPKEILKEIEENAGKFDSIFKEMKKFL